MMTKLDQLSVFFPAYNEEANIENTVRKALKVLPLIAQRYEVTIIDDGSKDKTGEIADRLAKKIKEVKVVHHRPNQGYGGALKTGFKTAKYEWVAFSDSDGQFDFAEIKKFLPLTKENDLILGYRLERSDSFVRKVFTFGWLVIARILFGLKAKDYSCGFKLIKKEVFEAVQPLVGEEKVTQIELLVKAQKLGFKFAEMGVHHYPREFGKQTGANLKVVTRSLVDLLKLWKLLGKQ